MAAFDYIPSLVLFEDLEKNGNYLMFLSSNETAMRRYEQYTRTGRYDETNMDVPYGYPVFNIAPPDIYQLDVDTEDMANQFIDYIKGNKIAQYIELVQAPAWGWFKFNEDIEIKSWFNDFIAYKTQTRLEAERQNNMGKQIALF